MASETTATAQALVHTMQEALHPVEQRLRQHPYLQALEAGAIAPPRLRHFVGEQCYIIPSDLRSLALLISRCAEPAGQQFFYAVLQGEAAALTALEPLATAVGLTPAARDAYEPAPGAQAYSAYLAWLCLYGSAAEVAAALAVNFAAWGANCGRMGQALRQRYGWPETAVQFFTQFATAPAEVSPQALAVMAAGLQQGVAAHQMVRAARMLQSYELMFWDTLYTLSLEEARSGPTGGDPVSRPNTRG
jgi:pyrroloquinoline quinone (PQQ) biosynthesis protein C